ncbi:hypothetical protein ABH931_004752 [Streptacidiphilus sp. MAP12-33]|uniref:hypothetical protein n=1 Tax=Streptacidiphilus sp. MAP12-33 TaxID=3156266 RepID=UPI003515B8BF
MESGTAALRQHSAYEPAMDLAGFVVHASDGRLGEIDAALPQDGDRGDAPARHARRLRLPVDAIVSIDLTDRVVHLDRTRDEIRRPRTPAGAGGAAWYLLREG